VLVFGVLRSPPWLLPRLRTEYHLIHRLLVARDGALVFEVYFDGRDVNLFCENLPVLESGDSREPQNAR